MSMRFVMILWPLIAAGCSASTPSGATIGDVATNLVQRARQGEAAFFASAGDGHEKEIIAMIQRSGMEMNHLQRLQMMSDSTARLDYHMLERKCHFQVELRKETQWRVTRIWLCR